MSIKSDQTVPDCLNKQIQTFIANENKKWQNKLEDENKKWQNKLEDENKKWQNKLEYENKKRQEKLADEIKKLSKKLDETIEKFEKKFAENQNVIRQLEKKIDQMQNEKSSSYSYTRLAGLHNDHLRCYMNAGLQALSGSQLLLKDIDTIITSNNELVYLNELKELVCKLNETNDLSFYANKSILFNDWKKSGMQDTFELISHVMNTIIKEYKKKYNLNQFAWNKHDFPMVLKLAYKLTCASHHNQKTPLQTDLALHVPIPEKRGNITITDVLNEVVEGELISEYSCDTEGCKSKTGKKYIKLVEVPNILCIHIQRNKVTSTGSMSKNNKKITLESDTLELNRSFFQCENYNCSYKLCSVIDHSGSFLMSGHYICYKKFNNTWYCADDQSVYEVDFQKVKNCNMYVLIYELERKEIDEKFSTSISQLLSNSTSENNENKKTPANHEKNKTPKTESQIIHNTTLSSLKSQQLVANSILTMLLHSDVFMESLVNFITKNEEGETVALTNLWSVLGSFKDNKHQQVYFDNGKDCLDLLQEIIEPALNEWTTINTKSLSGCSFPMCFKTSEIKKCNLNHEKKTESSNFIFNLTVNGYNSSSISIYQLLKEAMGVVNLNEKCICILNNDKFCNCEKLRKTLKFSELPIVLCIHVERNNFEISGTKEFQIVKANEILIIDKTFCKDESQEFYYTISSVIVNSDSNSVQYKCYKFRDNKWTYDGHSVDSKEINDSKIELIFYELDQESNHLNEHPSSNSQSTTNSKLESNLNHELQQQKKTVSSIPQSNVNSILTLLLNSNIFMETLHEFVRTQGGMSAEVEELWSVLGSFEENKHQQVYFDNGKDCLALLKEIIEPVFNAYKQDINLRNILQIRYDEKKTCYDYTCPGYTCFRTTTNSICSFCLSINVPRKVSSLNDKTKFNEFINRWLLGFIEYEINNYSCQGGSVSYKCDSKKATMQFKGTFVPKVFFIHLERDSRNCEDFTIDKEIFVRIDHIYSFPYKLIGFLYENDRGELNGFKLHETEWLSFNGDGTNTFEDEEIRDIQPNLLLYQQNFKSSHV